MNLKKENFARLVRAKRTENEISQSKLAELTGLSLRSIQRIENAEVCPREYSKNVLIEVLNLEDGNSSNNKVQAKNKLSKQLILSISSGLCVILAALAFISQSPTFPETPFEAFLYWIFIIILISAIQWFIWVKAGRLS